MIRETVAVLDGIEVVALDSASQIESGDRGRVIVAGSNGGRESGKAAAIAGCAAVVLNDAGIGKDRAGVAGLDLLDAEGVPGLAVSHDSAEISDGLGTWASGRISTTNETAHKLGARAGMSVAEAVAALAAAWRGRAVRQVFADPEALVSDALRGYAEQFAEILELREEPTFVARRDAAGLERVAIVSGGGSGHEPLHLGFVGAGMLDAAVPGQLFASPTSAQILAAVRAVDRGAGTLAIVKNYTGDVLNFTLAAEDAAEMGIDVAIVLVDDDLASDTKTGQGPGRRGTAATVVVQKLCGAAAAEGRPLSEVAALGRAVAARSRSLAVAFRSATLPGQVDPSFTVAPGCIEYGVGIHGERGVTRPSPLDCGRLVEELSDRIVAALGIGEGDQVIAIVNGLGGAPALELAAARFHLGRTLADKGVRIARSLTGSYVTALDMRGISITLVRVQEGDVELWDAPVRTGALAW